MCPPPLCHCWCPPFSAGHVAFLVICLPGVLLLVSALFRWPCGISIQLFPKSVTGGVRPFPLAMQHFYSFVSQVCYCWCPPFSAGHATFLFICLPGLSFVSQVCHCWCLPFSVVSLHSFFVSGLVSVSVLSPFCYLLSPFLSPFFSPFLLVFVSALSSFCLRSCLPFWWSLRLSCLPCVSLCLPSCLPSCWSLSLVLSPIVVGHCVRLVSVLFPLSPFLSPCWSLCPPCLPSCLPLSPVLSSFLLVTVSVLSPFFFASFLSPVLVGHCVRLVSLLSPFVSGLVSVLVGHCLRLVSLLFPFFPSCSASCWSLGSLCPSCLPSVSLFLRSCLPSQWSLCPFCLPLFPFVSLLVSVLVCHSVRLVSLLDDVSKSGLGNASLLSNLFGVYGGVIQFFVVF